MPHDTVARRTVLAALEDDARRIPDKTFIEYQDEVISYARFWSYVERIADGLDRQGLATGDKVMLYLENSPEYVAAWFGIQRAGCVVVPCSTLYKLDEIRYQIEHSDATVVIADVGSESMIREAVAAAEGDQTVLLAEPGRLAAGSAELNAMLDEPESGTSRPQPSPDELAMIMYTSGTTARPKGVMLNHGNLLLYAHNWAAAYHYTRDDRVLHYFPMYHSNGGIALLLPAVLRGATIVLLPKFSVSNFVEVVITRDITVTAFNATHVKYLLSTEPTDRDRAHRLYRAHFALELDAERRIAFEERFGIRLVELYGLTEAGIVCCSPVDALWKEGSGPPVPGYQIKIVDDEDDRELGPGEVGEIVVRSISPYGLSPGYYKQEGETAAVLRDGWLYTGDMGYVDEDGYLFFAQRKKDMIKRSGYNIGAAEVERVLIEHPSVKDAAVVGIPDDLKQESIVAFVVLAEGARASDDELIGHCEELLAHYKVPQHVATLDELPETFLGKIDKKELRSTAVERFAQRASA